MSKSMIQWTLGLLVVGCMLAMAAPAGAEWTMMDSADFNWKYEMTTFKPSELDLDGNGTMDFHEGANSGSSSIGDGKLTITSSNSGNRYFRSNVAEEIWRHDEKFTCASGYTIEFLMKVNSSTGNRGAFTNQSDGLGEGCDAHARLLIEDDCQTWGSYDGGAQVYIDLGTNDNTDGFHIFRIAQEAGQDNFGVWRDGTLLYEGIRAGTYNDDILLFGDPGDDWGGTVEIDYYRFTEGGYAPIPEPSTLMLLAGAALALLVWRRR